MNLLIPLSVLLLSACSSHFALLDKTLNEYAAALQHPISSQQATAQLTGRALEAATTSLELIETLGLRQNGKSNFEIEEVVDSNRALVCLDVSETYFTDVRGKRVDFKDRAERLRLEVDYEIMGNQAFISDMRTTGESC